MNGGDDTAVSEPQLGLQCSIFKRSCVKRHNNAVKYLLGNGVAGTRIDNCNG
jgi:hypothetical protein